MPRSSRGRTVAFQGELGAFSHSAALKLLGQKAEMAPCPRFKDVFERLKAGETDYAVIPIENTIHGSVHENYDHLVDYDFLIAGETSIRISHQLISLPGVSFRSLKKVYSHPVALNQCRRFFEQHQRIEPMPFYDTAGSVKWLIAEQVGDGAAIASETASEIYGGKILKHNIEDDRRNFTRFFLLTKQNVPAVADRSRDPWKTSVVFSTPNRPSALFRAVACFALRDINLTKIESRPLRGKPWEYLFYVEFIGNINDKTVQRALENLNETTQFYKLLGSYRPTP